ncbi:heme ABC transporter permease [Pelagibaculum spongiae]|uniref:Heme exporter protein C n=1 Tax=Pelagibaculum spongiae TaxID=2080658 RepID=A0A2V1GTU1_9GAMM|nr:heme ABC transporter permease [Pelagibaculum spongiae]PVZ66681.1 heme ABC transporter permease [Pelagibaculum spongiae]
MWAWFHRMASPPHFYRTATRWIPRLLWPSLILLSIGLVWGLAVAPADYQQGDSFRIIYIHVPAAMLSMSIYVSIAISAAVSMIWKIKMADVVAKVSAPIGAWFTFLALFTGAIWGKPMWGAYWVWDARLTSELILLFLYFGLIAIHAAIEDRILAAKAAGVLGLVGVVNIPIIHYSVVWWNTLHQGSTIAKFGKPSMDIEMAIPLFILILAFNLLAAAMVLMRTRNEIIDRESDRQWVAELEDLK